MTTAAEIRKRVNYAYCDVYVRRRLPSGDYEADWQDVTRFVAGGGPTRLSFDLDSGDFDLGVFSVGNIRLSFNNEGGKFSDVMDSRSLWASMETRHLTKVKIEAGYLDAAYEKLTEVVFSGLVDERAIEMDDNDLVTMTVLSREAIFDQVVVPAGMVPSATTASTAIFQLLQRPDVLAHMTVSAANIDPANDVAIEVPSAFDSQKLRDVLNELMLLTDSVLFIDASDNLIVRSRATVGAPAWRFYLNSETGQPDNIYKISGLNSGRQRVKNYWGWSSTELFAASGVAHLERFGTTKKSVDSDAITSEAARQAILDDLLDEWQFPKRELEIETDYLANELTFFDLVTLDVRPTVEPGVPGGELPIAGSALCGTAIAPRVMSGLSIDPRIGFKVIGITHELQTFRTKLKLREKGNQLNDGYVSMPLSKTLSVTFTAEATKDLDVQPYGMNAQRCKVEVIDSTYETTDFDVLRPNEDTIRLVSATSISGTFSVLIVEVEE